jgi:hypothetical protein
MMLKSTISAVPDLLPLDLKQRHWVPRVLEGSPIRDQQRPDLPNQRQSCTDGDSVREM